MWLSNRRMLSLDGIKQRFPGVAYILRNGLLLTSTNWAEALLRGVYAILIARLLGPELYGMWSLATATYAFAVALTFFGLETLIPLRLGKDTKAQSFIGTTFLLRLGLVVLAALGLALYALVFEYDAQARLALFIVLPALIGRGLVLWCRTVFLGLDQSGQALKLAVALRLVEVTAGLISLFLGFGLFTLLIIHAMAWLIEAGIGARRILGPRPASLKFDGAEFRAILPKGALIGVSTTGLAALTAIPIIYTRYLTDDLVVVGQMALALQIAALLVMGAQGVLLAALPVVGRAAAKDDPRLQHYPVLIAVGAILVFGLGALLAYFFAPRLIPALMGEGFMQAGLLLAPAILAGGLQVLPVGFWQVLVTQDRIWSGVISSWTAAAALLLALPPMVELHGALGALLAAAMAWSLRALILIAWQYGT